MGQAGSFNQVLSGCPCPQVEPSPILHQLLPFPLIEFYAAVKQDSTKCSFCPGTEPLPSAPGHLQLPACQAAPKRWWRARSAAQGLYSQPGLQLITATTFNCSCAKAFSVWGHRPDLCQCGHRVWNLESHWMGL